MLKGFKPELKSLMKFKPELKALMSFNPELLEQSKQMLDWSPAYIAGFACLLISGWMGWGSFWGILGALLVSASVFVLMRLLLLDRQRIEQLEQDLVASQTREARLRSTLNSLPSMVWTSGDLSERRYVDQAWTRVTGHPTSHWAEESWAEHVHPDDRQACRSAHRIAVAKRETYEMEYRLRRLDGEYMWVMDRGGPAQDNEGTFCGFVGVTIDISERKKQEAAMRERMDELTRNNETLRTLNARATDLVGRLDDVEYARLHAENSDRVKREFLAAMAHDLRKPVEEIGYAVDLIRAGEVTEQQRIHVDRIRNASSSLSLILGRVTELAACVEEAGLTESNEFDVRLLVGKVADQIMTPAHEQGLDVSVVFDNTVPTLVKGNPVRLRRVLNDVWTVAMGLSKNSRITMNVSRESKGPHQALICVNTSINGSNIPQERIDRAFYPAESVKRELAGLGLGTTKRMAELMGGQMGVRRDPDGHVIIWFTLIVAEVNPHCDGRRFQARLAQESLRTNLGIVLDLSMGGMRIRCTKAPAGTMDVELADDEETMQLRAEVAWVRRVGFRKHEAGLKFVDITAEQALRLSRLAMRNRMRRVMDAA